MVTPLDRPLRRALRLDGVDYVITLHPGGVRLVQKGRRKGIEVTWAEMLAGEVVLAAQLAGSLAAPAGEPAPSSGRS